MSSQNDNVRLRFVGTGDAFGSGGRFHTCFHVTNAGVNVLIDCGASSLIPLKAAKADLNTIDVILVTHFHADHFGGIAFFILDARMISKRTKPLTIAGPPGLKERLTGMMEASFPGSSKAAQRFELRLVELQEDRTTDFGGLVVTPYNVVHGDQAGPCFAYRTVIQGKTIAYTGDTEWTDRLVEVGRDADLFISEAYFYEKKVKFHLDLKTLIEHLPDISPKRLVITHLSTDMLSRLSLIEQEVAEDGMTIDL